MISLYLFIDGYKREQTIFFYYINTKVIGIVLSLTEVQINLRFSIYYVFSKACLYFRRSLLFIDSEINRIKRKLSDYNFEGAMKSPDQTIQKLLDFFQVHN